MAALRARVLREVGSERPFGSENIAGASFSADGKLLVTSRGLTPSTAGAAVKMWSFPEGRLLRGVDLGLNRHGAPASALATELSPDGHTLFVAVAAGPLLRFELREPTEAPRVLASESGAFALARGGADLWCAFGTDSPQRWTLKVLAATDGTQRELNQVPGDWSLLASDGAERVFVVGARTVTCWNAVTRTPAWSATAPFELQPGSGALRVSRGGDRVALFGGRGSEGALLVLDSASGAVVAGPEILKTPAARLAFSPDGARLWVGTHGGIEARDARTLELIERTGGGWHATVLEPSPDGEWLVLQVQGELVVRSTRTGAELPRGAPGAAVEQLAALEDRIAIGEEGRCALLRGDAPRVPIDANRTKLDVQPQLHTRSLRAEEPDAYTVEPSRPLLFTPDGQLYIASGRAVVQVDVGGELRRTAALPAPVVCLGAAATGRLLVAGVGPNVYAFDLPDLVPRGVLRGHAGSTTVTVYDTDLRGRSATATAYVRSVDLSMDGERIVSAGDDNTLRVWSVHELRQLSVLGVLSPAHVAFAADGAHVIVAEHLGRLRCLNLESGAQRWSREPQGLPATTGLRCFATSPSRRRILTSARHGSLFVLDAADGSELAAIPPGNRGDFTAATFVRDDQLVVGTSTGWILECALRA